MERIEKTIEVNLPIETVYAQWTRFEQYPRFMSGVRDVRRLDETHLRWRGDVGGTEKEWDTEITEQVPDCAVSWRSTDADAPSTGTVRLEPLGTTRTRVRVAIAYERRRTKAVGGLENASQTVCARVERTAREFKRFMEGQGAGGCSGIIQGPVTAPNAPAPSEPQTTERPPRAERVPERASLGTEGDDKRSGPSRPQPRAPSREGGG